MSHSGVPQCSDVWGNHTCGLGSSPPYSYPTIVRIAVAGGSAQPSMGSCYGRGGVEVLVVRPMERPLNPGGTGGKEQPAHITG